MAVYHLCHGCTVAIVNDDYSAFDLDESYADDLARVEAFVERVGYLVDAGMVPQPGYWDCEACDTTECGGSAHAMETI